jgi:hypothetical protein
MKTPSILAYALPCAVGCLMGYYLRGWPGSSPAGLGARSVEWERFEGAFDLSAVTAKVAEEEGWAVEYATRVETEYKRFFFLIRKHKAFGVPSDPVDAIWHGHVLATRQYMADCRKLFGFYLHHQPSYTMEEKVRWSLRCFPCMMSCLKRWNVRSVGPGLLWPSGS